MEHFALQVLDLLARHGYVVILLIMVVEETGIPMPIPGDGLLLFAGYLVSTGNLSFVGALLTVDAGALIGATVLYWVARRGGRPLVLRYGRVLRVNEQRLDQLKSLFDRFGRLGPGVGRLIPGLRIYTSALAGLALVPYSVFMFNVLWACTVWALGFLILGTYFGVHWREYTHYSERAGLYTLAFAAVGGIAYLCLRRVVAKRRR